MIKSVDPNGKIDATYANPNPINISRAEASVEGSSLRIFIELRGAGYPGSTYTLTHVPTGDRLTGEYFQAAIRQKFDVIFRRARQREGAMPKSRDRGLTADPVLLIQGIRQIAFAFRTRT